MMILYAVCVYSRSIETRGSFSTGGDSRLIQAAKSTTVEYLNSESEKRFTSVYSAQVNGELSMPATSVSQ